MNHACHLSILELHNPNIPSPIYAKKGDTGRKLQFILTDNAEPYTIASDCYAVFTAKKPDGCILFNDCTIEHNTIIYTFTSQTCSVPGSLSCEIRLYGADSRLITSPSFILEVEDTVYSDGDVVESATEANTLAKLLNQTTALVEDLERKLEENAFADAHSAVCFTSQSLTDDEKTQARANIAAAPDGYGLGASSRGAITSVSELDTITNNGWYCFYSTATTLNNIIFNYASLFVSNYASGSYVVQELHPINTNTLLRRYRNADGTTWSEWESDNPPMTLNVEYRTTERYQNKTVYTKLLDFGALPNAASSYLHQVLPINSTIVAIDGIAYTTSGEYVPLTSWANVATIWANTASGYIGIKTVADVSSYNATVHVKYTKD